MGSRGTFLLIVRAVLLTTPVDYKQESEGILKLQQLIVVENRRTLKTPSSPFYPSPLWFEHCKN
jgi:hypothetical protein